MAITTLSSREFIQRASKAKRAANNGPVFITDRGRPAHVLMSIEHYQKLTQERRSIADALAMPESDDIDFDPPRAHRTPTGRLLMMVVLDTNVAQRLDLAVQHRLQALEHAFDMPALAVQLSNLGRWHFGRKFASQRDRGVTRVSGGVQGDSAASRQSATARD